jgi:serine/threonine protein kinase
MSLQERPEQPEHPDAETLESYVVGMLEGQDVDWLEAHLRRCRCCTDEVRRQAQTEMALGELAAGATFCAGCQRLLMESRCPHCGAVGEAGGYRVQALLVQNARGRMYLARDAAGQAVALKELAFVQPPHPEAVAAFEREARLLRQLSHPRIPRFLASFARGEGVNTRLYLAQEYVEGESLEKRLAHHQFSEGEARAVAEQVLSILEYLQGLAPMVFHRDIKPANLIQRADGQIALVDFGAARDLGPTAGATLVGTFGYMPIEQLGGVVDATTDLHALGATICQLVSRREPWSFLEDPSALARLNLSAAFRNFLARLTARRAADRFPDAATAAAALRALDRRGWRPRLPAPPALRLGAVMASGFALALGGALIFRGLPRDRGNTQPPRMDARIAITDEARTSPPGPPSLELSPPDGRAQLAMDPTAAPYVPRLPADLAGSGARSDALFRICVSTAGEVTSVHLIKGQQPRIDAAVATAIRAWRYKPYLKGGRAVPFCTSVQFRMEGK